MKRVNRGRILLLCALLLGGALHAQEKIFEPGKWGHVENWLVAVPIPLAEKRGGAALDTLRIQSAATLAPRENDKLKVDDRELVWKSQAVAGGRLDFNAIHGAAVDHCAGFAVCYVIAPAEVPNALALTGSDDQVLLFVNGKEVVRSTAPRGFRFDEDVSQSFALKKGVNIAVLVVVNEGGAFYGSLSFADKNGNSLPGIRISLSPP